MLNRLPSAGRLRRLNRRQRKKLRVGEFQELVFEVRIAFARPLDEEAYAPFWDAFIDLIESRGLLVSGLGGRLPLKETDGIVSVRGRGSPSDEDRQAVVSWLLQRPEVARAEAGEFFDGWYGDSERPASDETLGDIANHPERLQAVDAGLVRRLQSLVGGVEVDLDAALSADDE